MKRRPASPQVASVPTPSPEEPATASPDPDLDVEEEDESRQSGEAPENLSLKKEATETSAAAAAAAAVQPTQGLFLGYHPQFAHFPHFHQQQQQPAFPVQRSPVDVLMRVFPGRRRSDVEALLQR